MMVFIIVIIGSLACGFEVYFATHNVHAGWAAGLALMTLNEIITNKH